MKLSCCLTGPEMQLRKATVLADIKQKILEVKELPDGYAFAFPGLDSVIDQLTDFIKSERRCCSFLTLSLKITSVDKPAWLNITGPEGTKEFIRNETGFTVAPR